MGIFAAFGRGCRLVWAAPRLLLFVWLLNLAAAVPATVIVGVTLAGSFGTSEVAERMERGFDSAWFGEFQAGHYRSGIPSLAVTFSPTVAGPGPVLDHLEGWWSGKLFTRHPALLAAGVGYALLWAFLLGGVLDRFARPHGRAATETFTRAGGRYFFPFVRLALLQAPLYLAVYLLARRLYGFVEASSHDVTEEWKILLLLLLPAALAVFLLHLIRLVFDYAKVSMVVEGRRSALRGAWTGVRTVLRRPVRTAALYLAFGTLGMLLMGGYAAVAPGPGPSTLAGILLALLFAQLYLAARLAVRLALLGGEVALYRSLRPGTADTRPP